MRERARVQETARERVRVQETARERGEGWKIESNQEAYKQQAAFDKGFYFSRNRTKKIWNWSFVVR